MEICHAVRGYASMAYDPAARRRLALSLPDSSKKKKDIWNTPGRIRGRVPSVPRPSIWYTSRRWIWVISVSAYREEFSRLIRLEDIDRVIHAHNIGTYGYSFVMDGSGNSAHDPSLQEASPSHKGPGRCLRRNAPPSRRQHYLRLA